MLNQTEMIALLERCAGDTVAIEECLSAYITWKVVKGRSSAHILEKLRSLTLYMRVTGHGGILDTARDVFLVLASEVALGGESRIGLLPAVTPLGRETANMVRRHAPARFTRHGPPTASASTSTSTRATVTGIASSSASAASGAASPSGLGMAGAGPSTARLASTRTGTRGGDGPGPLLATDALYGGPIPNARIMNAAQRRPAPLALGRAHAHAHAPRTSGWAAGGSGTLGPGWGFSSELGMGMATDAGLGDAVAVARPAFAERHFRERAQRVNLRVLPAYSPPAAGEAGEAQGTLPHYSLAPSYHSSSHPHSHHTQSQPSVSVM